MGCPRIFRAKLRPYFRVQEFSELVSQEGDVVGGAEISGHLAHFVCYAIPTSSTLYSAYSFSPTDVFFPSLISRDLMYLSNIPNMLYLVDRRASVAQLVLERPLDTLDL